MIKLFSRYTVPAIALAVGSISLFSGCGKTKNNASGLITCNVLHYRSVGNGDTLMFDHSQAGCFFTDPGGITIDAGNPTINGTEMDGNDVVDEYYYGKTFKSVTTFSNNSTWYIPGSKKLRELSFEGGPINDFRMELPDVIMKSNGLSFFVNIPSNFAFTEVRVTINCTDVARVYKSFPDGNISFTAAELDALPTADNARPIIHVEVLQVRDMEVNKTKLKLQYSVREQDDIDVQ